MSHSKLKTKSYRLKASLLFHCVFRLHLTLGLVFGMNCQAFALNTAYL